MTMCFKYKNNQLYCENTLVRDIVYKENTPLFIYSRKAIINNYNKLKKAFSKLSTLICYSVKCNSNIYVLKLLSKEGAGFDIVSGGELFRVIRAGSKTANVVYAGVGKSTKEIIYALNHGILMFTVESESELERINAMAQKLNTTANVAVRVNPDVDPKTHRYITTGKKETKFGLDIKRAKAAYQWAMMLPCVKPIGVHMHIGSQILSAKPYAEAIDKMAPLINELKDMGVPLEYFDIGGGIGIVYKDENPVSPEEFGELLVPRLKPLGLKIIIEPGRYIVGNAGILVTKVEYIKQSGDKTFVIVDAAMNDLIRPSLYTAYHDIIPLKKSKNRSKKILDIVGPICESGDFLAKDREITMPDEGDFLAVKSAGAYSFSMASNYNSRVRPAETLVSGGSYQIIRRRETWDDLLKQESVSVREYVL